MQLSHYRDEASTLHRWVTYEQFPMSIEGKPHGLWVSVDGQDDWLEFCQATRIRSRELSIRHGVQLAKNHNVTIIETLEQFDRFEYKYGASAGKYLWGIDWSRVALEFDGIIIAPYRWERRYRSSWYLPWDCASGCIWNLDVIASFEADPPSVRACRCRQSCDESELMEILFKAKLIEGSKR